jgi:hypothetical protein
MVYLEKVPEGGIYTFDNKYLAEQIAEEFFLNTEEYILSLVDYYSPSDFEIKSGDVEYSKKTAKDKLTYLILKYEREEIVAGVFCASIGIGNWNYIFFRDLNFLK